MIGIIIQARTSSTRLPNKVLLPLPCSNNITVLEQVIRRTKASTLANVVIVATTDSSDDNSIVQIAKKSSTIFFRGDEENVLSRYYHCAKEYQLDTIVRITSDCPCIDPAVIDLVIDAHLKSEFDYTSNSLERTFPRGQDVEVFNFQSLEDAFKHATLDGEKEHVTPYMYSNPNSECATQNIVAPQSLNDPTLRITLDTEEDYALLCALFEFLYPQNELFDLKAILRLVKSRPWLKLINKKITQKQLYSSLSDEIDGAIHLLELHDMLQAAGILKEWKVKTNRQSNE